MFCSAIWRSARASTDILNTQVARNGRLKATYYKTFSDKVSRMSTLPNTKKSFCTASTTTCDKGTTNEDLVIVEKLQMTNLITLIGINRPEKRNCVNHATALKLDEAISNFENDPSSSVAVLYGKGGNFCAGYDLEEVSNAGKGDSSLDFLKSDNFNPLNDKGLGPMGPSRRVFKKPIVAAISGYAVAGGLELALMCDARVVEDTAVLGVFCRRFGVPLIDGGTVRLPHLIGLSRAMDLILTGRPVKGKEAFEIGLCSMIVACGTCVGQAVQYANQLSKFPQKCLNRDRLSAYNAMFSANSFEDAVKYEMENGMAVFETESIQGATRFKEGVGKHGSFNMNGLKSKREEKKYKSKL